MVFFEICRQQPAYFGPYENIKKEDFWKDWTFPENLEVASVLYEKEEQERLKREAGGIYEEEEDDDDEDEDDDDVDGEEEEDESDDDEEEGMDELLDLDDSEDDVSVTYSSTASSAHTHLYLGEYPTMGDARADPIDVNTIIEHQMQMIRDFESGIVDNEEDEEEEEEAIVEGEEEEEEYEPMENGHVITAPDRARTRHNIRADARKKKVGTLQDLYAYGANASDVFPHMRPSSSWSDVIQDRSTRRYTQNAMFMNNVFFESLNRNNIVSPDDYERLRRDIEELMV